jgi:hypothetical protein
MVESKTSVEREYLYNQKVLLGCGTLLFLFLFGMGVMAIRFMNQDRQATQYPGSIPISNHSNYRGLPSQFRWDNTYRTPDPFAAVYNWYSLTFEMGAESRAIGQCILLEKSSGRFRVERTMSVFICDTLDGQMIYVSRSTALR